MARRNGRSIPRRMTRIRLIDTQHEMLGQVPGPRYKSSAGDLSRARERRLRALYVSQTVPGPVYLINYLEFGPRIRGHYDRLVLVRPSIIGTDISFCTNMDSTTGGIETITPSPKWRRRQSKRTPPHESRRDCQIRTPFRRFIPSSSS